MSSSFNTADGSHLDLSHRVYLSTGNARSSLLGDHYDGFGGARQAAKSSAAYAASKAGVIAFSRHLAGEYGREGIRINCIAPSAFENDRMRS